MRVLCGGPARETESAMFRLHVEGLEAQGTADLSVVVRHELVPDGGGPRWHREKIERVAKARQEMMRVVQISGSQYTGYPEQYDALLMVDTDVILGPGVLERMWAVDADVVFGVFWTQDNWGQPPGCDVAPQVWWTSPFDWKDLAALNCWNALCEPGVNEIQVNGGGACTLIRGRGFESHYWPLLESLKGADRLWCGEDRTYCLGLEARGITMKAVTGLPIVHLYDKALQTPEMLTKAREMVGL